MAKQPCIETLSIGMHASKNPAAAKKCWENGKKMRIGFGMERRMLMDTGR